MWNNDVLNELQKVIDALPKKIKHAPNDLVMIINIEGKTVYITQKMIDKKVIIYNNNKEIIWNKNRIK